MLLYLNIWTKFLDFSMIMFVNCIPLKGKTSIYNITISNEVLVIDGMHFGIYMNLMNDDM